MPYPVSSFVVRGTRVTISLFATLSWDAEVIVAELVGYAAANVEAPYCRKLGCCKHANFLINGQLRGFTVQKG